MKSITLNETDLEIVREVARELAEFHAESSWSKDLMDVFGDTFIGLKAEYAVMKYFNRRLLALKPIDFNREYIYGGDGGFDFTFHGLKIDVKLSGSEGLPVERVASTKADLLILVNSGKYFDSFDIVGMCPISIARKEVAKGKQILEPSYFLPLQKLVELFPDEFDPTANNITEDRGPRTILSVLPNIFHLQTLEAMPKEQRERLANVFMGVKV